MLTNFPLNFPLSITLWEVKWEVSGKLNGACGSRESAEVFVQDDVAFDVITESDVLGCVGQIKDRPLLSRQVIAGFWR